MGYEIIEDEEINKEAKAEIDYQNSIFEMKEYTRKKGEELKVKIKNIFGEKTMSNETFNKFFEEQVERSRNVLCKKASEYATEDRLHNFRVAAKMQGCDEKKALAGMMAKHTVSIYDMCISGKDYPIELWGEKITDHINYLLLLNAIVREEK